MLKEATDGRKRQRSDTTPDAIYPSKRPRTAGTSRSMMGDDSEGPESLSGNAITEIVNRQDTLQKIALTLVDFLVRSALLSSLFIISDCEDAERCSSEP